MKHRAAPNDLPRDQRGFTLLEAIIAMAILTAGILAVCMMQVSALRASMVAFDRSEATGIATALIECFQNLPYSDLKVTQTAPDEPLPATSVSGEKDAYNYYGDGTSSRLERMMKGLIVPAGDEGKIKTVSGGLEYTLKWAVQEERDLNGEDKSIRKNIRVYLNWDMPSSFMEVRSGDGQKGGRLEFTTTKYPNLAQ